MPDSNYVAFCTTGIGGHTLATPRHSYPLDCASQVDDGSDHRAGRDRTRSTPVTSRYVPTFWVSKLPDAMGVCLEFRAGKKAHV